MIRSITLILCLTFIMVSFGMGGEYYVTTTGNDSTGDGSILKPWKTITHALTVLDGTLSTPHVIHVAPGTYSPTQTGEIFPLEIKSYISLQGAGDSLTILDGSYPTSKNRIIRCDSVTNIKIDGFTIKRGTAPTDGNLNYGGGISISNSSYITVSNNLITKNRAVNSSGGRAWGGGLYAKNSSFLLLTQNKFISNISVADGAMGGGITIFDGEHCIISNNLIESNINFALFGGAGGGIYCQSDPIIRNNTLDANISDAGGGISCNGSALIIRNTIKNDTAGGFFPGFGGGVLLESYSNNITPIIGGSIGNGNNIHDNIALDDYPYKGLGYQLANYRLNTINARFNFFGNEVNPHDTDEVYGKFYLDPYMTSPIVFDTSNLVTVPSPINFDTVALGKSKEINVALFNVTNSLTDSIKINNIGCQNPHILISEQTFNLTPAGRHSIIVALTPTFVGTFIDSLRIETNIGEFIVHVEGIISDSTTSVEIEKIALPTNYSLQQNYPNPFNPSTIINYQLPTENYVTLKIYNVFGQEVRTLVDGMQEVGYKSVEFSATNLASGIYYYKLTAGASTSSAFVDVKKMILIR